MDLHCHLDLYKNPLYVVEECLRRRLYVLSVTTTPSAWVKTNELARGNRRIKTALGLHPQLAEQRKEELILFDRLLDRTRYIGEVGLDGSKENKTFWNDQLEVFNHILDKCNSSGGNKILSIHSRNAATEVLDTLDQYPKVGKVILHWFTGEITNLERAINRHFWFSVNPVMFKSKKGLKIICSIPKDRLLLESDGPFTQLDGSTLFPWDAVQCIGHLSSIWNSNSALVENQILKNFKKLIVEN